MTRSSPTPHCPHTDPDAPVQGRQQPHPHRLLREEEGVGDKGRSALEVSPKGLSGSRRGRRCRAALACTGRDPGCSSRHDWKAGPSSLQHGMLRGLLPTGETGPRSDPDGGDDGAASLEAATPPTSRAPAHRPLCSLTGRPLTSQAGCPRQLPQPLPL